MHREHPFTLTKIKTNNPGIIIKDRKEKRCMLGNRAITLERNTPGKFIMKLIKYKDLGIEINRMWGKNTQIMLMVIRVQGFVQKETEKLINHILGSINTYDVQKIGLLSRVFILQKIMSIKWHLSSNNTLGL